MNGDTGDSGHTAGDNQLKELELRIDAAKHLSTTHRSAHLERRKFELKITFGPILVLFLATATILVRGHALQTPSMSVVAIIVIFLSAICLVFSTSKYLARMQDANIANRQLAQAAEDWLAKLSLDSDWDCAKKKIPEGAKEPNVGSWRLWQVTALSSAAVLLIVVACISLLRGGESQEKQHAQITSLPRSLVVEGSGTKTTLEFGEPSQQRP